jgi:excisionase family DNA binding protein
MVEQQLFDVDGTVRYLVELGAAAATKNFVRNLIARGEIAHLRVGKKFYFSKKSIDAWLEKRERRAK